MCCFASSAPSVSLGRLSSTIWPLPPRPLYPLCHSSVVLKPSPKDSTHHTPLEQTGRTTLPSSPEPQHSIFAILFTAQETHWVLMRLRSVAASPSAGCSHYVSHMYLAIPPSLRRTRVLSLVWSDLQTRKTSTSRACASRRARCSQAATFEHCKRSPPTHALSDVFIEHPESTACSWPQSYPF